MKKLILILFALVTGAAYAQQGYIHGNGDPRSITPTPNCGQSRFYIDDSTQQMYQANAGSPCAWTPGGAANLHSPGPIGDTTADTGAFSVVKGNGTAFYLQSGVTMFGDSITASNCTGVATSADCYSNIVTIAAGAPAVKYAVSGDQAADQVNNQMYPHLAPSHRGNSPVTIMIGTNDAGICGASLGCQNNYFHTLLSGAAWATIPTGQKIQPQLAITGGACTTTGAWTNVTYGNDSALQSIVPGATITCNLYNTGAQGFYFNWLAVDGYTSTAALNIDSGAITDTLNSFGYNGKTIATNNNTHQTAFANRYALGAGSHSFTVTVGTAGVGNPFTFLWAGAPTPGLASAFGNLTQNPPRIYIGGVIRTQSGGGGASDVTTGLFDTLAQQVVTTLYGDGAYAYYAPTRDYVNNTTDFTGGTLANGQVFASSTGLPVHPGDAGSLHLADAFLSVMPLVSIAGSSPAMNNTIRIVTNPATLLSTDGVDYISNGATITFPAAGTMPNGQEYCIHNYHASSASPITGGGTNNVPTSIPAGGTLCIQAQSTNWWRLLEDGFGPNFATTTPINGQLWQYNGSASQWQPTTPGWPTVTASYTPGDMACAQAADTTIGALTITGGSSTVSDTTVTVAAVPNYFYAGVPVVVTGATPSGYNVTSAAITSTTATTITYTSANNPAAWSSGGTIALACSNQVTDAITTSQFTFANNYSVTGGLIAAGTTYALNWQLAFFGASAAAAPSFQLDYNGSASKLFLSSASFGIVNSALGHTGMLGFDVNALSPSLLSASLRAMTLPTTSTLQATRNAYAQPVPASTAGTHPFQLLVSFPASGVVSGTYTSGGSITGTVGQTCTLTAFNNSSTATATVALTGTNVIAGGTALTITARGNAATAAPTTATLGNGTATCSGTATIATVLGGSPGNAVNLYSLVTRQ